MQSLLCDTESTWRCYIDTIEGGGHLVLLRGEYGNEVMRGKDVLNSIGNGVCRRPAVVVTATHTTQHHNLMSP